MLLHKSQRRKVCNQTASGPVIPENPTFQESTHQMMHLFKKCIFALCETQREKRKEEDQKEDHKSSAKGKKYCTCRERQWGADALVQSVLIFLFLLDWTAHSAVSEVACAVRVSKQGRVGWRVAGDSALFLALLPEHGVHMEGWSLWLSLQSSWLFVEPFPLRDKHTMFALLEEYKAYCWNEILILILNSPRPAFGYLQLLC